MTSNSQPVRGNTVARAGCVVAERWIDGTCVLAISGTIDMATVNQFEAAIAAAKTKAPAGLVVDLSDVEFLASAGMNALAVARSTLLPATQTVVVADGPATSRPLKLVGIADLIELFTTLDEALAAVTSQNPS